MSANPVSKSGGVYSYDFTTAIDQAYNSGQKDLRGGYFGMFAADANANGMIDNLDKIIWAGQAGTTGYKTGDLNLDGQLENGDKNDFWLPNVGEGTQVP